MTQDEIVQDFIRKYLHTYIFVQEANEQEENLFYVEQIEAHPEKIGILHLQSEEIGKIRLNFGSAHTLKFMAAPVGVFQNGVDAYMCRRNPAKQYRRGICHDNTHFTCVTGGILRILDSIKFPLVDNAFKRVTFPLKEALAKLKSKTVRSVALRDNYALCQPVTTSNTHYVLFFWGTPIALISLAGKVDKIFESVFEKQIATFMSQELL